MAEALRISDNPHWVEGMRLQLECGKRTKSGRLCERFITGILVCASTGYVQPDHHKDWPILDLRNSEWRCYQHTEIAARGKDEDVAPEKDPFLQQAVTQILPAVDMYPSLHDLLFSYTTMPIPQGLIDELFERYNKHGMEYATDQRHEGRIVNACMSRDSVQDAREELTDAVFNLLVQQVKVREGKGGEASWRPKAALGYVLRAWEMLQ